MGEAQGARVPPSSRQAGSRELPKYGEKIGGEVGRGYGIILAEHCGE